MPYTNILLSNIAPSSAFHPIWGEAVRAVVVRRENATADERELINFCEGLIGRYKCPSSVVFAAELPKLATGKINKPALRERYGGAASTGTTRSLSTARSKVTPRPSP